MGFLANVASGGLYGALVDSHYERISNRICKSIDARFKALDDDDVDEKEDIEIEDEDDGIIVGRPEHESAIQMLIRLNDEYDPENPNKPVKENRSKNHKVIYYPEVIETKFSKQDILRNIAAAVNHFSFSDSGDIQTARTQIAAILYMSGLADTDTIFEALNKDAVSYAVVNGMVCIYSGKAMDEKIIPMDIEKDIDDTAREKLKMVADWEAEYLSGHSRIEPDACQLIHSLFAGLMSI